MHDATPALMSLLGWGLGWGVGCLAAWWVGELPACACTLGKGLMVLASYLLTLGEV